MKLSSILNESLVLHHESVSSFDQAIDLLATAIGNEFSFEVDTAQVRSAVLEREAIASTIVGNGVAIPHANPGLRGPCRWHSRTEDAVDAQRATVQVFSMVLTSESASQLYLNTVGSIAKLLKMQHCYQSS